MVAYFRMIVLSRVRAASKNFSRVCSSAEAAHAADAKAQRAAVTLSARARRTYSSSFSARRAMETARSSPSISIRRTP